MDGQIKIWDLRKTYTNLKQDPVPFHMFPYPGQGIRKHGIVETFLFLKVSLHQKLAVESSFYALTVHLTL